MPTLYSAAAFTVVAVYCVWRAYAQAHRQRLRLLSRRVAYMLWVMAEAEYDSGVPWRASWPPAEDCGYE